MNQPGPVINLPSIHPGRTSSSSVAVLIAVPKIKLQKDTASRRVMPPHIQIPGRTHRHRQRRLRREVRLVSYVLLALIPIASACTLGWSNHPDRILACSISDPLPSTVNSNGFADVPRLEFAHQLPQPTTTSSEAVVLSIEPGLSVSGPILEAPVTFPGFILPDDSREGSVHEGS
jgi:hypothetical protein